MKFASFALAAALLLPWSASAAEPSAKDKHPVVEGLKEACMDDIKQLCADVQPGGGRIIACLRNNEDKLSAQCKAARAAARSQIQRKSGTPE